MRADRLRNVSVKAEQTVGVIFDDEHSRALTNLQNFHATILWLRQARGVVKRRNRVHEFGSFALCCKGFEGFA